MNTLEQALFKSRQIIITLLDDGRWFARLTNSANKEGNYIETVSETAEKSVRDILVLISERLNDTGSI